MLTYYGAYGWDLYMPGVGIAEVLYVLCKKLQEGIITGGEYARALSSFMALMTVIKPSPNGDMTLIQRAEQIRTGYGCSRTSDGLFLALTEQLTSQGAAEIATFDIGMKNQAATNAPSVNVVTLP